MPSSPRPSGDAGPPRARRRAGPFETVGAWLGVWTPGRDVEVPPFPRAKGAAVGLAVLVVAAAGYALAGPRIAEDKRVRAESERRALAQARAERIARLRREGRPVSGSARSVAPPPSDASRAQRLAARLALVEEVERAVAADARRRVRRGEMEGPILRAGCAPHPPRTRPAARDLDRDRGRYSCTAITSDILPSPHNVGGVIGYPYRAVVDFDRFGWTFCRVAPPPGELAATRAVVDVPRACRG